MKRLTLKKHTIGKRTAFGVDCGGYECHYNCPLFKAVGGYPVHLIKCVSNKKADYRECAVVLVWAKFYKLY